MFWSCRKTLDLKFEVNFKVYDVTDWITQSCITHIAYYLKKQRQPGNEI